jgi:hypothetical protein
MTSRRIIVLAQLVLVGIFALAVEGGFLHFQTNKPDSVNKGKQGKKNHYWVCRRYDHQDDMDANNNIALAIHIYEEGTETKARIWQYDDVEGEAGNEKYKFRTNGRWDCNCIIQKLGTDQTIKTEHIRFETADGTVIGWATRFMGGKGHLKAGGTFQKDRRHSRFVFRYNPDVIEKKEAKKATNGDPCEDPPNDDVLEEEPIEEPMDPTTPPDLDYAP